MNELLAFHPNGAVHQKWNDEVPRTYYEYDANGVQVLSRPYNDVENAEADIRETQRLRDGNKKSVEDKLDLALGNVKTIIDTTTDPVIKDLARAVRLLIRSERKQYDTAE